MTGARQVLIERDDLEELVKIVREATTQYVDHVDHDAAGFPVHYRRLDEGEQRLLARIEHEVLG